MNLRDWLAQILACESTPQVLDLTVLEAALELLDERAAENLADFQEPGEVGREAAARLREMAKFLHWLCGDLDAFLDTLDFGWVRAAMVKAQSLLDIEAELRLLHGSATLLVA